MVMLAKGNRSRVVTDLVREARRLLSGFHRRPAARLARDCIKKVEVVDPRTRHGGHLENRRGELSGLHCRRRQGQRLFQGISEIKQGTDPDNQVGFRLESSTH